MTTTAEAAGIITRWADPQGSGFGIAADVSYSFYGGGFAYNDAQTKAAVLALDLWDDVARLNFFVDNADPEIAFVNYRDRDSASSAMCTNTGPGNYNPDVTHRVGYNRADGEGNNPVLGNYAFEAMIHEIGHAIGFAHPGDYNAGDNDDPPLTYETDRGYVEDTRQYSVMSYFSGTNTGANFNGQSARTPLLHDIASAQHFYGANMTTRTGDTVYGFNSNAGPVYSLAVTKDGPEQAVFCIWDAGGNDTLDMSSYAVQQTIDLAPNSFSSTGGLTFNMSMADAVDKSGNNSWEPGFDPTKIANLIENAVGGSGTDVINGNQANNRLDGGAGNINDQLFGKDGDDILIGGSGGDVLDGGKGFDTAVYNAAAGEDITIKPVGKPAAGVWTVTGAAQATGDALSGIEAFRFGSGNDRIVLKEGRGAASLTIDGAAGDDGIYGSDGLTDVDTIIGGEGKDVIYANGGVFHAFGGSQAGLSAAWTESLADNDTLYVDRTAFDAKDTLSVNMSASTLGTLTGSDGSTARGFARMIYAGSGYDDYVQGLLGDDLIDANDGNDTLFGNTGNDKLDGWDGNDDLRGEDGDDWLLGGAGADKLMGGKGDDRIETGGGGLEYAWGEDGNDTMIGSDDAESMSGDAGNDKLSGFGGDDRLFGGDGDDTISGGDGNDNIEAGLGVAKVDGGAGNDFLFIDRSSTAVGVSFFLNGPAGSDGSKAVNFETMWYYGGSGGDQVKGGDGIDRIWGFAGADKLDGGNGNDDLWGGDGDDVINGGGGVDTMTGGNGNDRIETGGGFYETAFGEAGDDTLIGSADPEELSGGTGNDKLSGLGGDDLLYGGDGNDTYFGGDGDDEIQTGTGVETADGGAGNDFLFINRSSTAVGVSFFLNGPAGSDGSKAVNFETMWYYGGSGDDQVRGGDDGDVIWAYAGVDTLDGGNGNDDLWGGDGDDVINGGGGTDSLAGANGNDRIETGGGGNDTANGDAGNDTLIGSADGETLNGGADADTLSGLGARDFLNGGDGDDLLNGGDGNDELSGGAGLDRLLFDTALNATTNLDLIVGFVAADDTILLDRKVFAGLAAGALKAAAFAVGTGAADASDRIVYDSASGALYFDSDGKGGADQIWFATNYNHSALTYADFQVV